MILLPIEIKKLILKFTSHPLADEIYYLTSYANSTDDIICLKIFKKSIYIILYIILIMI